MEPLRTCTAWRGQHDCLACDGRENTLFAGLSGQVLAGLHVEVANARFNPGDLIYPDGMSAEHVWVIRTGAVKLTATSWDGVARIVRVLKPGDIAGMEGLLAGAYSHSAYAVGEVRVCATPLEEVRQLCLKYPDFQWGLMQQWQSALRDTEQWLLDATTSRSSARVRMARLLLRLRDGESSRIYNFSREDLGSMLGIAIETASRIVAGFMREKLLVRRYARSGNPNRFFEGDIPRLERVAQGD